MEFKFQKRRGLGTVIATLIILIASVILGAGVIFFGGSMFQTNTQQESVKVSNSHIWVATNNTSTAAFAVQNTGGKPVSLTAISIRGLSVPLSSVFFNTVDATANNIQTEFTADYTEDTVNVNGIAGEETFTPATGPVSLDQGKAVIIYINDPANIDAIDAGLSMTLNIQAGQASAVQSVSVVSQN
ncbi:MAG: hypothetical protein MN733_43875 [Nitrososphaera sp.]|nr:hypothetical protein [Nitrososphaera sp.]